MWRFANNSLHSVKKKGCHNLNWYDKPLAKSPTGKPQLCYKDACLQEGLKALGIDINVQLWSRQSNKAFPSLKRPCWISRNKERNKEGPKPGRYTSNWLDLLTVRKGLLFLKWSFQPHKVLLENHQSECSTLVFRDWRLPILR